MTTSTRAANRGTSGNAGTWSCVRRTPSARHGCDQRWATRLTRVSLLLLLFLGATLLDCEAQVYYVEIYNRARTTESFYFIGSPPFHCGYVKYREYRDSEDRSLSPDLHHLAVRRPVFIKIQFSVYSTTLPGDALAAAVAVTACIIATLFVAGLIQKAKRWLQA
jgi:hypothetical protein